MCPRRDATWPESHPGSMLLAAPPLRRGMSILRPFLVTSCGWNSKCLGKAGGEPTFRVCCQFGVLGLCCLLSGGTVANRRSYAVCSVS